MIQQQQQQQQQQTQTQTCPYDQLPKDQLLHQFKQMGILVLLDSPQQLKLGIDNIQLIIGSKFKGVKFIPLGTHFVSYSLKSEEYLQKQSMFINIDQKNRVVIRRWNESTERFEPLSKQSYERYLQIVNNMEYDQYLGVYPLQKYQIWKESTNFISPYLINRIQQRLQFQYVQDNSYIYQQDLNMQVENHTQQSQQQPQQQQEQQEQQEQQDQFDSQDQQNTEFNIVEDRLEYTFVPKKKVIQGMSQQQLTQQNFDKSTIIKELIENNYNKDHKELLGELQFCFIKFLLGEHYQSLEQWKIMFMNISECIQYVDQNIPFFQEFLRIAYYQILQFPKDFFVDEILKDSFIKISISNIQEWENQRVKKRVARLNEMLEENFNYQVEKDYSDYIDKVQRQNDYDDQPVIVEDVNQFYKL